MFISTRSVKGIPRYFWQSIFQIFYNINITLKIKDTVVLNGYD